MLRRFATLGVIFFSLLGTSGTTIAQVYTPGRGDPDRKAIMDAIRPHAERDLGPPVEFVIYELNVSGAYAFMSGEAQRKGGAAIDRRKTPYAKRYGSDGLEMWDCCHVEAVLQKQGNGWRVLETHVGSSDAWYAAWCSRVPPRLISICR
jgi:hypothetical protein